MRMSDAFRRYGVEIKDPQFNSSALSENPRQVILSLWSHNFSPDMSRYAMETAHWKGSGKHTFRAHLEQARAESLPIRVVVATSDNPAKVRAGNAARASNDFEPDFSLVGQVVSLAANSFELAFERTVEIPEREMVLRDRATAKYWHVAEAVQALAKPSSTAEIREWLEGRYPGEDHSDLGANLSFLTVNDTNRRHYDKTRKDWSSNSNRPRDLLFRRGKSQRVTYEPFRPSIHGHWTLQPNQGGNWEAVQLPATPQSKAEAEGQEAAFAHLPPLDSDHDARVWTMRAVAQRRGQSFSETNCWTRMAAVVPSLAVRRRRSWRRRIYCLTRETTPIGWTTACCSAPTSTPFSTACCSGSPQRTRSRWLRRCLPLTTLLSEARLCVSRSQGRTAPTPTI